MADAGADPGGCRRFIDQLPGWTPTAAYGVALVPVSANGGPAWSFPVVNVGWSHRLPALVLGIVTGRRSGTDTDELSSADLRKAVERLVAVFIESLDDEVSSPYDAVLRAQIARGEESAPYV